MQLRTGTWCSGWIGLVPLQQKKKMKKVKNGNGNGSDARAKKSAPKIFNLPAHTM